MTRLHNMSVPPRSVLRVERCVLKGRRYHVDLCGGHAAPGATAVELTALFRRHGVLCAAALIDASRACPSAEEITARIGRLTDDGARRRVERQCAKALEGLRLPAGFGVFIDEEPAPGQRRLGPAEAIAVLAARSGPLLMSGRFEPSLISVTRTTLWFPAAGRPGGESWS